MSTVFEPEAAPPAADLRLLEIVGGPGGASFGALRELWSYREVVSAFVVRQVKVKYKQAAIGIGWWVIQPVASAVLFAVFFGRYVHVPSDGAPYFLFALAGMVAWMTFSNAAAGSMESLVANQMMLRKVYFPREVLPLAAVGAVLVDLVPALLTVMVGAALYGVYPTLSWLLLPLPVLLLALTALGLGLGLSALNVYYRDVRYVLPFALQLGLFASPVVYPLSVVPETWRTPYAIANPVAAGIDSLRRIIVHGDWPDPVILSGAFAWALVLAYGGYVLFKRLERGFSDRV